MRYKISLFFILNLYNFLCYGGTIYVINEKTQEYTNIEYDNILLDPGNKFSIEGVSQGKFDNLFTKIHKPKVEGDYLIYWVKLTVKWEIENTSVLTTPLVAKSIDLYVPNQKGSFNKFTSGVSLPFDEKLYKTNTHSFSLFHGELGVPRTFYLKIVSYQEVIPLVLVPNEYFTNNALTEYFFQGIMLGIVFVAAFYNIILFLKLKEAAYLYYSLYVIFFGFFGMLIWHYPFSFLWWIEINDTTINILYNIVYSLSTVFFLLYAKNFFYVKNKGGVLDKVFKYLIWTRLICLFLGVSIAPFLRNAWIDTVILLPVFPIGYYSFKKRFLPSKNFIVAFSALFFGMLVHSLSHYLDGILPYFNQTNIFFVCGCTGMFLFSLSLGERMQLLLEEKDYTKTELILQLKHNEILKNDQNQDLERKVKERTMEIEERNKQLDTFVYRASHDIKGPLRSILGLSKLGEMEALDDRTKDYFKHISKSTSKLDATLTDLLNVVKMNHADIESLEINFRQVLDEILSSFQHHPNYQKIHFSVNIPEDVIFKSDYRLIYSIIQNLVENSINYFDNQKANSYLKIAVLQNKDSLVICLEDNGIGISEEYSDKIFEMFFKIDTQSSGTGLGMYLVKQTLERLGGTIEMVSRLNVGTKFILTFQNKIS